LNKWTPIQILLLLVANMLIISCKAKKLPASQSSINISSDSSNNPSNSVPDKLVPQPRNISGSYLIAETYETQTEIVISVTRTDTESGRPYYLYAGESIDWSWNGEQDPAKNRINYDSNLMLWFQKNGSESRNNALNTKVSYSYTNTEGEIVTEDQRIIDIIANTKNRPPLVVVFPRNSGFVTESTPTIVWSNLVDAVGFNMGIYSNSGCSDEIQSYKNLKSLSQQIEPLDDGVYYICVTSQHTGGVEIIGQGANLLIDTAAPANFTVRGPGTTSNPNPSLIWTAAADANQVQYQVNVHDSAGCESPIMQSLPKQSELSIELSIDDGPLADGDYIACVTAVDTAGNETQSNVAFSIDSNAGDGSLILAPLDGETINSSFVNIRWQNTENGRNNQIKLSTSAGCPAGDDKKAASSSNPETTWEIEDNGTYYLCLFSRQNQAAEEELIHSISFEVTDLICAGNQVDNFCWYLGNQGQSCNAVCNGRGGYNIATRDFTGSAGTDANCAAVMDALGAPAANIMPSEADMGYGCYLSNNTNRRWVTSLATIPGAAKNNIARACACNQ